MLESVYQAQLIDDLKDLFPGCLILMNDSQQWQGIPDLLILFGRKWAMLEVKASAKARIRPNQPYYVDQFNRMSYAAFIYPENEEEVLNDLQLLFASER